MRIRSATLDDLDRICTLLTSAQLPTVGVNDHVGDFLVVEREQDALHNDLQDEQQHGIVAAVGLERYGDAALLRSMVVHEAVMGSGLGTRLVHAVEQHAKSRNVGTLVLLTTTADRWFATLGYEHITRGDVPLALLQSAEFRGACPASAVVMRKRL
jgi:amino-acid N-acetyltransferase